MMQHSQLSRGLVMPDNWDDTKPDWANQPGGVEVGRPGEEQSLVMEQPEQTMYQFSYGDYDTKPKSEGETDQDCCDNAKETWVKGQDRWIKNDIDEAIQEAKNDYHDGMGVDAFFDMMEEMNNKVQKFPPEEIVADRREAHEDIERHFMDQYRDLSAEKTRVINSMECGDFKMFVQQAASGTMDIPPMIAETAIQVYKEWMDCEGTDFGGDDDMMMTGEPMELAFRLLKSQNLMSVLLKIDFDDDAKGATDEERLMDRLSNRSSGFQDWEGPKRESKPELSEDARRARGQHGTSRGMPSEGIGVINNRDRARRENKRNREMFREAEEKRNKRRIAMNERDDRRTTHPGSLLFNTDDLDPSASGLPPRIARMPIETSRRTGNTWRDDKDDYTKPLGEAYRGEPESWDEWIREHPELWDEIQSGTVNMDRAINDVDETHRNEIIRDMVGQGLKGLDKESGGFVDEKQNMDNVLEEAGRRGHLDDMEHEYYIDEDGEMQVRGDLQLPEEQGKALAEHMKELEDAPTVGRRVWVDSSPERHNDLVKPFDETASHSMGQSQGDTYTQASADASLQERPTFYGLPFNEETGFTTGEPMDIAWDSLLKSRKV